MTEERALALLRKKDPASLSYFIDRYTSYVSTVIWNVISPRMSARDAEELCSDVFIALWQNAEKPRTGHVKAYLGGIARHKAADAMRRQGFDLALEEDIITLPDEGPEAVLERRETTALVRRAVDSMPQPDRDIFVRFYYYCQKTADIAREMNISPPAVRQRLARGRERLRIILEKGGIEDGISNF